MLGNGSCKLHEANSYTVYLSLTLQLNQQYPTTLPHTSIISEPHFNHFNSHQTLAVYHTNFYTQLKFSTLRHIESFSKLIPTGWFPEHTEHSSSTTTNYVKTSRSVENTFFQTGCTAKSNMRNKSGHTIGFLRCSSSNVYYTITAKNITIAAGKW